MNNVQERWPTTSWGMYTQQPYDPFCKRVCVNTGACSHVVYLPHGYWEKWSYCRISVVSNFQVQSVAIIKDSVTYGFGADIIFFPYLVVVQVSESLFRNFYFFMSLFIGYSLFLFYLHFPSCGAYHMQKNTNRIELTYRMRFLLWAALRDCNHPFVFPALTRKPAEDRSKKVQR